MDGENSMVPKLWDAVRAISLGLLAYGGLALATGKLPLPGFELPKEVTLPLYILLYSFLGGVAYLLSALVAEHGRLANERKELEEREEELKEVKETLEQEKRDAVKESLEKVTKDLEKVRTRLEKLRTHRTEALNFWIKLARIPFGMLMAAAFYLMVVQLVPEELSISSGSRFLAGSAFVVAFFPKVIMEGFHGLANRLMGESTSSYSEPNEESGTP